MNVNGSRFHMMLGKDDWGACTSATPAAVPLKDQWEELTASPLFPAFDKASGQLTLLPMVQPIADTPGEQRFTAADHRDAAADRNGNLYVIADDRRGLLVRSAGDGRVTPFWPLTPRSRRITRAFTDAIPDAPADQVFAGLAVTTGDFLVVGTIGAEAGGLLRFDLVGGGAPERMTLPSGIFPAFLAPTCDRGLWLLDAASPRLFRLDPDLRLASQPVKDVAPAFAPEDADPKADHFRAELVTIDVSAATAPVAIATLCDGSVILLDAPAAAPASLHIVDPGKTALRLLRTLKFSASCFTATTLDKAPVLLLAETGGNQARRVRLVEQAGQWEAEALPDTLPLRRFGGRALVTIKDKACYDSGASDPIWVPVVEVVHRRFAKSVTFLTTIYDGAVPQCVWDRIRLDACIPPGASVTIEARATDEKSALATPATAWVKQPSLVLSSNGPELPGKRAIAAIATNTAAGRGSWDLLLQNITGRYAQLRITLSGDERVTPRLRALRLWYPRFSWVQRFLPGVYREEPASASFLERFLANFEGIETGIEDRIAGAEALLDPRTIPAEMLEWLSSWYEVALDPSWDERRRRLFIANAARFFGWRGTSRGLLLALKLALDTKVTAQDFDLERPAGPSAKAIRIVETYVSRTRGRVFPPADPITTPGIRSLNGDWIPEEGAAGLWARWPEKPVPTGRFPLFPPVGKEAIWTKLVQAQFGFVPMVGQGERARWQAFQGAIGIASPAPDLPTVSSDPWLRYVELPSYDRRSWQDFLVSRYRTLDQLNAAHNSGWDDFASVPLPHYLPGTAAAARDWLAFEGQELPISRAAHRFAVLLPRTTVDADPAKEAADLALARRIVTLEKPAHTIFDVRFFWAMNRVGEARLGLDSAIGQGSRAPELVPGAVLGRAYVGASFVDGPDAPRQGRERVAC